MKKAYAKAAVKYMNDEEIEKFVSIPVQKYKGFFNSDDMVSFIDFKNYEGRTVSVTIRMYEGTAIGFEATEWDPYKNVHITKEISYDIGSSNLWLHPNYWKHKEKEFLIYRSSAFYTIILNGCMKVLKKFDKDADNPFLVMQGYLDEYRSFKTKAKLALSLHF